MSEPTYPTSYAVPFAPIVCGPAFLCIPETELDELRRKAAELDRLKAQQGEAIGFSCVGVIDSNGDIYPEPPEQGTNVYVKSEVQKIEPIDLRQLCISDERAYMEALANRIAGNAHPEEDSRLNIAYAIAVHLNLSGWNIGPMYRLTAAELTRLHGATCQTIRQLQKHRDSLQGSLARAMEANSNYEGRISDLAAKVAELEDDLDTAERETRNQIRLKELAQSEVAELQQKLIGAEDKSGYHATWSREFEQQLGAAKTRISELTEQVKVAQLAIEAHLNPCGCVAGCEFCKGKLSLEEAFAKLGGPL